MPIPIEAAIVVTLVIAPAHMRSMANPGTLWGSPARMATLRPRVRPWSPVCDVAAMATSSILSFGTSPLRSMSPMVAFTARSSDRVFQYMARKFDDENAANDGMNGSQGSDSGNSAGTADSGSNDNRPSSTSRSSDSLRSRDRNS